MIFRATNITFSQLKVIFRSINYRFYNKKVSLLDNSPRRLDLNFNLNVILVSRKQNKIIIIRIIWSKLITLIYRFFGKKQNS